MVSIPLLNQVEISEFLGVSPSMIVTLTRAGMPIIESSNQKLNRYDLKMVVKWYIEHLKDKTQKNDFKQAQIRKINLEADRIAMEIAEKNGDLIKKDDIEKIWSKTVLSIRNKLLLLPKKVHIFYDNISDSYDMEKYVEALIFEALEELSNEQ